jgi:hypothetical protein
VSTPPATWGHSLIPSLPSPGVIRPHSTSGPLAFDRQAIVLKTALERIAVPLARAAAAFVASEGWKDFGHARLDDHARERFGRSGRWVRDLAAIGQGLEALPGLAAALTGEDGGRPLGLVAALCIARTATAESVPAWVRRARTVSVRELKEEIRVSRTAGSAWPPDEDGHSESCRTFDAPHDETRTAAAADLEDHRRVRLLAPRPLRAAFDEGLDLYRAVEGHEASVTSYVDALLAESWAGSPPQDSECFPLPARNHDAAIEQMLARATRNWANLERPDEDGAQLAPPCGVPLAPPPSTPPEPAEEPASWNGPGDATDVPKPAVSVLTAEHDDKGPNVFQIEDGSPDGRIRALLALQDELERRLGNLLARMGEEGAWKRLRFASLGHYAEQRLGWARTTARDRARLARVLRRLPTIGQAYFSGRLGFVATLCLTRILADGPVDESLQQSWVERAERATVKRLRDEARALRRWQMAERFPDEQPECSPSEEANGRSGKVAEHVPDEASERFPEGMACGGDGNAAGNGNEPGASKPGAEKRASESNLDPSRRPPRPLTDTEWHASLRRAPGMATKRVWRLGRQALAGDCTESLFGLTLPADLAGAFLAAIESARKRLHARAAQELGRPGPTRDDDASPSLLAARMFSSQGQRVPAWVGLLALVEEFVATWDVDQNGRGPAQDAVHIRDGFRCMAPGCTSRRHLEDHHIVYRSRHGSEELWNRVCLCAFHHRWGEHGELASCRGMAPLWIAWSLGRGGRGGSFRNEMRVKH